MCLLSHNARSLLTGIILLFVACEKDKTEPSYQDAVLKGTTYYYMSNPLRTIAPLSDVQVKAIGPYGTKTAHTDVNGQYEIKNIGNGTYEIEFFKEGWGAVKQYSVQIYGNEVLNYDARMYKYPEFDMPVLKADDSQGYLRFRSDLPYGTIEVPQLRAFIGKTRDVNCYNYYYTDYVFDYTATDYIYYDLRLTLRPSGETVYIVLYIINPDDIGEYDPFRALMVFPSINPKKHSQVFTYNIP